MKYSEFVETRWGCPEEWTLANAGMGLAGEAGEVADVLKKHLFHGHPLDKVKVTKEIGDVLYYVQILLNRLGLTIEEVQEQNMEKLKARYPEGFSSEASIQRKPE